MEPAAHTAERGVPISVILSRPTERDVPMTVELCWQTGPTAIFQTPADYRRALREVCLKFPNTWRRLTQEQVARALGVDRKTLQRLGTVERKRTRNGKTEYERGFGLHWKKTLIDEGLALEAERAAGRHGA
jgi:hypothetical protein